MSSTAKFSIHIQLTGFVILFSTGWGNRLKQYDWKYHNIIDWWKGANWQNITYTPSAVFLNDHLYKLMCDITICATDIGQKTVWRHGGNFFTVVPRKRISIIKYMSHLACITLKCLWFTFLSLSAITVGFFAGNGLRQNVLLDASTRNIIDKW